MKLPWKQKEKIKELREENQDLQKQIENLEEEKETFRERFEAEKERRSKLSAEKQKAEEELNKLRQKIQNSKEENASETSHKNTRDEVRKLSFTQAIKIVEKLNSVESPENDLSTIYAKKSVNKLSDIQGLKGSISAENYNFIDNDKSFVAFLDEDFIQIKLRTRPFFNSEWKLQSEFDTSKISKFAEQEKQWAAVSAGKTRIFREKNGEILEREEISTRVDSKQKKGGFSQGRFERKRQEQIDEHVKIVKQKTGDSTLLLGEESMCKKLPGEYLGGFNYERKVSDALYNFRLVFK